MTAQRILTGAMLALAGIADAHAIDSKGGLLQVRNDARGNRECKPTTETEYCTVTVQEIVTVAEYIPVTTTVEQSLAVTVTVTQPAATCPPLTSSSSSSSTSSSVSSPVTSPKTSSSSTSSSTSATSTATGCPVPPTCGNQGFDWAYYNNSARNTDTTYSAFHPDAFKSVEPVYVGTTDYVGGTYSGKAATGRIYGAAPSFALSYFALNHHAYLYSCEGGTYNITVPYADDAVYVWVGAKAYAGWTDADADAVAAYDQPHHVPGHAGFSVTLAAGAYVPLRFFYGQAQNGGSFTFTVTAPSGQVLVSDAATDSPYVVRYSCDGALAPRYPAFGSES